jgi:CHAT domain-containing protein
MRKSILWTWGLVAIALAASFAVWKYLPWFFLQRAERALNDLTRSDRPFSWRWAGALPGNGPSEPARRIEPERLRPILSDIQRADAWNGRTAHSLQLRARTALLTGDPDRAIGQYELAKSLARNPGELDLELGIAFALRAKLEHRALDYEHALEYLLAADRHSRSPETLFDTALLFEEIPLPSQAADRWREVAGAERQPRWREEAARHLADAELKSISRDRRIRELTSSPESYVEHADSANESLEIVLDTALSNWLPRLNQSASARHAVERLARELHDTRHDIWLTELLRGGRHKEMAGPLHALSDSWRANSRGNHIQAEENADVAERGFLALANPAGAMRARLEKVYSLHRRSESEACLSALQGVRKDAERRGFVWIAGQAWLEEISCLTQTRRTEVIGIREEAFQWMRASGYPGLTLRAASFLTESYVSFGSRLSIWNRGVEGVRTYWASALPPLRGYAFYFTMASSARSAGDHNAAVALLRESTRTLGSAAYRKLLGLLLADLSACEVEAGLERSAAGTLEEMARLFAELNPQETLEYRQEAEIVRAESETAAGHPREALARLQQLAGVIQPPYRELGVAVRRRFLPALGNAFLGAGDVEQASRNYAGALEDGRRSMEKVTSRAQRENAQREMESAWRGLAAADLRRGRQAAALDLWEAFRGGATADSPVRPPSGVVLLTYAPLPGGISGWIADQSGVEQRWLDAAQLRPAAERFARLAADRESPLNAVNSAARQLYRILIAPFEARLPPGGVLVIDADGPVLGRIPWAALEDQRGQPLLERFALAQTVGWARVSGELARPAVDLSKVLIMAEPALGAEISAQYAPLMEQRREAVRLRRRLQTAVLLPGKEATLDAFVSRAPLSTMLYFAGHGVSHGGFGALLLASADPEKIPLAMLTADEIARLNLRRLELVVLAACSAGAGEQTGIVNLDSLVRSFLEAGASRVIAAGWNVNSGATADLMGRLFDSMLDSHRPSEALRHAALAIRRQPSTSHPYYWAGFQVYGVP